MIKLILYPPYGTKADSKSLKFEVSGLESESIRIRMENATHGMSSRVFGIQKIDDGYMGFVDINIPKHLTQSTISIFAYVEEQQKDGSYKTIQICPAIYSIKNDVDISSVHTSIHPSFIGPEDLCSIRVSGKSKSKKVVSINDKFFKVSLGDDGVGSVSVRGKDVLGKPDIDSVSQFPVYIYNEEDNYVKKTFSELYLNILPSSISMHADFDPRCDPTSDSYISSGNWVLPTECIQDPDPPIIDPFVPTVPPNGVPVSCKETNVKIDNSSVCRIFGHSVALLNNGLALHAYLSPDVTITDSDDNNFNINQIYLSTQRTSIDVHIIANRNVVVEPKIALENFVIHVEEDLWNSLSVVDDTSISDVYVVLFNAATGFQRINITSRSIDEYTGSHTLIGEMENNLIEVRNWIFCVNAVFYHASEVPTLDLDILINPFEFPSIENEDGYPAQIVNISLSSSTRHIGANEEIYAYIIAEAIYDDKSQLFFNSVMIGKDGDVDRETNGWMKLTSGGNNCNPKSKIGSDNNLHVVWESDRTGEKQVYYGVLGLSSVSSACTTFSSVIDKYSEFLSRGEDPFYHVAENFLTQIDNSIYNPSGTIAAEYSSEDLVNSMFTYNGGSGTASFTDGSSYIQDAEISGNPLLDDCIAFNSLRIFDTDPLSQFNYQFEFDFSLIPTQTSRLVLPYQGSLIDEDIMDDIYESWKGEFTLTGDENVQGQPVYEKTGEKFVIGRVDGIFDRIVPVFGSYEYNPSNPSIDNFQIDIRKQNSNLKDFSIGIMLEKTRFLATNIYSYSDLGSPSDYTASEEHYIYTGMAKLVAFIKTEDDESTRSNYIIIREFPEKINVLDSKSYTAIVNYTKLDSLEVDTLMDTYGEDYTDPSFLFGPNRFLGQLSILIDGVPRFSQSFISILSNIYNYFDIGIGIPYGGYYVADKMSPSKMGVYENIDVVMNYSNMEITSPTYTYNTNIINLPLIIRNMTKLRVIEQDDDSSPSDYTVANLLNMGIVSQYSYNDDDLVSSFPMTSYSGANYEGSFPTSLSDMVLITFVTHTAPDKIIVSDDHGSILYDSGFIISSPVDPHVFEVVVTSTNSITISITLGSGSSVYDFSADFYRVSFDSIFPQIPLTFSGINKSPDITIGAFDDVHLVWQSNADRYWNIYYSNAVDKFSPFRFDTMITKTESNSLRPSVSVCSNGKRLITWHDDRNGSYDIFAARSLSGYESDEEKCKSEMIKSFENDIVECNITIDKENVVSGTYVVSLEFYYDAALNNLYKTIYLTNDNKDRWYVDGSLATILYGTDDNADGIILSYGGSLSFSYVPGKDDGVFDRVLYVKLVLE